MIKSDLEELLNEFENNGYAKDNNVDISIPREDFPKYIESFKVEKLDLPSEEEAKKVYDELGKLGFINFELAVETLYDWKDPSIYSLTKDNKFSYIGDFDSASCCNLGVSEFYIKVLESTYYLYCYKKSFYRMFFISPREILAPDFLGKFRKSLLRFKNFIARITLYKEAFIKLDMKKDLKLCEENYKKATRIYSLGIFAYTVLKNIQNSN